MTVEAPDAETSGIAAVDLDVVVDAVNRSTITDDFVKDLETANVGVVGRTILISDPQVFSPFGFEESLREIVRLRADIARYPERLMLAEGFEDIREAAHSGRTAFYVYFQSPEPLANQMWRLDLFRTLGLRVLQLTYNQRSLAGDGCSEPNDGGLSEFGKRLVAACNELGITVDAAHAGPRTTHDIIEASEQPVLLSHTGAKALYDHPRCKTDDEMRACAERGGIVGVAGGMASLIGGKGASLENVLDHIEYIVGLVGPEHVGIGMDFIVGHERDNFTLLEYKPSMYQEEFNTGVPNPVDGLQKTGDLVNMREGLRRRGYSPDDVSKIMGRNFLRVFEATWT